MRQVKVSVIVPVHGIPVDLLKSCWESLLRQTLKDFEALWVLDGRDGPAEKFLVAESGADSRMKVLKTDISRGVSAARNLGLASARGKWFGFVDADDEAEPEMLEVLVDAAERGKCPLAGCGWRRFPPLPGESGASSGGFGENEVFNFGLDDDLARGVACLRNGSCCARLFLRKCFGGLRFDEDLRHGEDLVFLQRAVAVAGRMAWVPRALYLYRVRSDSASRRPLSPDGYRNWLKALGRRMELSRPSTKGNVLAQRFLALDTWFAVNDIRVRRNWPAADWDECWRATRAFSAGLGDGWLDVLPAELRATWKWEMRSARAFYKRPRWLNGWLWRRARRTLAKSIQASGRKQGAVP